MTNSFDSGGISMTVNAGRYESNRANPNALRRLLAPHGPSKSNGISTSNFTRTRPFACNHNKVMKISGSTHRYPSPLCDCGWA
jgi:hypothetical protein